MIAYAQTDTHAYNTKCIYEHTHLHIHTCTYTYTYAYTYTYTYTITYIYSRGFIVISDSRKNNGKSRN